MISHHKIPDRLGYNRDHPRTGRHRRPLGQADDPDPLQRPCEPPLAKCLAAHLEASAVRKIILIGATPIRGQEQSVIEVGKRIAMF